MAEPNRSRCERRWLQQIRVGDEAAFEELFLAYHPRLCRFARTYVRDADSAREVVQCTFIRLWERRQRWTVRRSLAAYLYGAVRNQALNHLRRARADQRLRDRVKVEAPPRVRTPREQTQDKETAAAVQAAIEELPPRRRRVYVLHRRHGLSYAEIAEAMGIAVKTVENQMGRALKTLRDRLAAYYADVQP